MKPAELYNGWILKAQEVFCVDIWDETGNHRVLVPNAISERDALKQVKRWLDRQQATLENTGTPIIIRPDDDFPFDDIPF